MSEEVTLFEAVRKTKDGRVVCAKCGCVAVTTSNGRWICGGMCPN